MGNQRGYFESPDWAALYPVHWPPLRLARLPHLHFHEAISASTSVSVPFSRSARSAYARLPADGQVARLLEHLTQPTDHDGMTHEADHVDHHKVLRAGEGG